MEEGMERWGVPVPHGDKEEETELALSFDDAEFQHDPSGAANGPAPDPGSGSDASERPDESVASDGSVDTEERLHA
jgi:hypothetical protein